MDETNSENTRKSSPLILIGIVAVVLVIGVGFILAKGKDTNNTNPVTETQLEQLEEEATPTDTASSVEGTSDTPDAMTATSPITVTGGSFYFKPNEIRVKKGEKVTIVFTNTGGIHDFAIDEFDIKTKQLSANQSETVEFTPDKTGTFEFYCSVGTHRKMGMKGNLIVE